MNVGQILETHLGLAAKGLGEQIDKMLQQQRTIAELRIFLDKIYNKVGGEQEDLDSLTDEEILVLAGNLRKGVPLATPVFDGAEENQIKELLEWLSCHVRANRFCLTDVQVNSSIVLLL